MRKQTAPEEPAIVETNRRIVFASAPAAPTEIELRPEPGWLAAVKLELLPEARHAKRIVRTGDSTTVQPHFAILRADGTVQSLRIRHAQADHYAVQYANGFEIIGVQSRWKTDPALAGKSHTAVYFLDPPVRLSQGEGLRLKLSDHVLGCIRVSTSPLAPPDLAHPEFPTKLASTLAEASAASACYLRSTAWNAGAFKRVREARGRGPCLPGWPDTGHGDRADGQTIDHPGTFARELDGRERADLPAGDAAFLAEAAGRRHAKAHSAGLGSVAVRAREPADCPGGSEPVLEAVLRHRAQCASRRPRRPGGAANASGATRLVSRGVPRKRLGRQAPGEADRDESHVSPGCGSAPELRDVDPNNRLLASQNARRLEAEAVRDNALAIAGLLNPELGGPPCKPYQPAHYYDGLQFPDRDYHADRDDQQYRRGIYMHWQRTFAHPMLANFDAPSREDCIAMRSCANSPQQALTLLNDPTFVEAARVWAGRLLLESAGSDAQRLERAFKQAVARSPKPAERADLIDFLARMRAEYRARPDDAARLLHVGLAPAPAVDPVEFAAWTNVCRVILNLHETITRF